MKKEKVYRYSDFVISEKNINRKRTNLSKIYRHQYFECFCSYVEYTLNTGDLKGIEKAYNLLFTLEKEQPYHQDILKIRRHIHRRNSGYYGKLFDNSKNEYLKTCY